ncbi:uncharacterized protein EI90DRAFT_3119365 [Cantharellus anzutake]|uniref:uncharacterized protein n=1 Tax=Cantharellus anzutake TaxID=1750568 RepID=UPI001905A947|nr:uncharacterized protein EI90DRAFT_3119365 [Cantharellus anzutake]KAF8337031.1 hypothetical protein EI90DRAFT_3119365 [Cantharellus anzutake]
MKCFVSASLALAGLAFVQVGQDGQLVYYPQYITAEQGDIVNFIFSNKNHTVTQSSFDSPCSKLLGTDGITPVGLDTGFVPIAAGQSPVIFNYTVNTTDPLWFYCKQQGHCRKGMVFAINPPATGNHTFENFLANAENNATNTNTTGNIIDVVVGANGTLTFSPPFVNAQLGDEVRFTFVSKNHTVTQSTFENPCTPQLGPDGQNVTSFDTGFVPVANGSTPIQKSFNVSQSGPLWFYCRQTGHCSKGMVFAINPDTTGEHTFANFHQKALDTNPNGTTKIIDVLVGSGGSLTFSPPSINATAGDEIRVTFASKNHTLTQSSFEQPCTRPVGPDGLTPTGFDSGFMPVENSTLPQISFIMPQTDAPLWFFCRQTGHCGKGMVFAINAPSTGNQTFELFQQHAISTGGGSLNGTGPSLIGGALGDNESGHPNDKEHHSKSARTTLLITLGVMGGLLCLTSIAAFVIIRRRRASSRGIYARAAAHDRDDTDAFDYDFDQAERKGFTVLGTSRGVNGSGFTVIRGNDANQSAVTLKYTDELIEGEKETYYRHDEHDDDEKGRMVKTTHGNTYSDPYDPPSGAVIGSYTGRTHS